MKWVVAALWMIMSFNSTQAKYNIVFIVVDDMKYFTEDVHLYHIEKLAAKGVKFENAFAQQALCAPSRNSMLTGRRPDSLRLYDFYSYWRHSAGNFTTLPQFFKENGYETYAFGKVFHPGRSSNNTDDYPYSWTTPPYHPPTQRYENSLVCPDQTTHKLQKNLICPIWVKEQPNHTLPDIETVGNAVRLLREKKYSKKPYFIAVGFHKPHIPLKFPQKYLERVPLKSVSSPLYPKKPKKMPLVAWHPWSDLRKRDDIKRLDLPFPFGTMPANWTLQIRRSYYAASLYVDDLVGHLLSNVDYKKTIVVFTSDHGWSTGENGLWAKFSNFNVALRVPLILKVPNMDPTAVRDPVELIDVFPTLVELTGLAKNIPKCLDENDKSILCFEGKSLVPLMFHDAKSGEFEEPFAISQYPRPCRNCWDKCDRPKLKDIRIMGYSIRTLLFRYTEWIAFNCSTFEKRWHTLYGSELYDHILDPDEGNNVADVDAYEVIVTYLSKLLRSVVDANYFKLYNNNYNQI